jgi:hypothetical protein
MAVRFTAVHVVHPGTSHEHIASLKATDDSTGKNYEDTRAAWHDFIKGGGVGFDRDAAGNVAYVAARVSSAGNQYVQTYRDQVYTDNLMALPRY